MQNLAPLPIATAKGLSLTLNLGEFAHQGGLGIGVKAGVAQGPGDAGLDLLLRFALMLRNIVAFGGGCGNTGVIARTLRAHHEYPARAARRLFCLVAARLKSLFLGGLTLGFGAGSFLGGLTLGFGAGRFLGGLTLGLSTGSFLGGLTLGFGAGSFLGGLTLGFGAGSFLG
ncbi:MAG: hypothetical protein JJT95_17875, partial [Pararhodobacter sp.]|nr:hypothetical protein [Pararhodobacter sp.]